MAAETAAINAVIKELLGTVGAEVLKNIKGIIGEASAEAEAELPKGTFDLIGKKVSLGRVFVKVWVRVEAEGRSVEIE